MRKTHFEPWVVLKERNGIGEALIAPASGKPLIAVCCGESTPEIARLVAAAPELLASLKFATKWMRNVGQSAYLPESLRLEAKIAVAECVKLLIRVEKGEKE